MGDSIAWLTYQELNHELIGLGLPYVLRHNGTDSYWEEVVGCTPNQLLGDKEVVSTRFGAASSRSSN